MQPNDTTSGVNCSRRCHLPVCDADALRAQATTDGDGSHPDPVGSEPKCSRGQRSPAPIADVAAVPQPAMPLGAAVVPASNVKPASLVSGGRVPTAVARSSGGSLNLAQDIGVTLTPLMPSIPLPSQAPGLTPATVPHASAPVSLTWQDLIAPGSGGGANISVQLAQTSRNQATVLPQPGFGPPSAGDSAADDEAPPAASETPTAKACTSNKAGSNEAIKGACQAANLVVEGKANRKARAREVVASEAGFGEVTARDAAYEGTVSGHAADEETAAREAAAFLKALGAELKGESVSVWLIHPVLLCA